MATAIRPLRKYQMGIESVKGTLVAATRVLPGNTQFNEKRDRYHSDYPRGFAVTVGGAGSLTKQWVEIEHETELSAEDILWPCLTGVLGDETPSGAGTAKTWNFVPEMTTAIRTLNTATAEFMRSDGTTNHYVGEAGYCMTSSFKIDSNPDDIARLSWKMFGRARQSDTPTSSLAPYTSREPLAGGLLSAYCDTSWAGLGGTQLTGVQRAVSWEMMTGVIPQWNAQGRTDLDYAEHAIRSMSARLGITWELDAVGAARFASYRANDIIFIRLKWVGSAISGGGNKTVQIDGAYRFAGDPTFAETDEQTLLNANLEAVLDTTGDDFVEITAINTLAAVA